MNQETLNRAWNLAIESALFGDHTLLLALVHDDAYAEFRGDGTADTLAGPLRCDEPKSRND